MAPKKVFVDGWLSENRVPPKKNLVTSSFCIARKVKQAASRSRDGGKVLEDFWKFVVMIGAKFEMVELLSWF